MADNGNQPDIAAQRGGSIAAPATDHLAAAPATNQPGLEPGIGEIDAVASGLVGLVGPPPQLFQPEEILPLKAPPATPGPGRRRRDPHATRNPVAGLTAVILFALAAAFFGWVSADPFWLSFGWGSQGTVTITTCQGGAFNVRCVGRFDGADGDFTAEKVRVSGVPAGQRHPTATVPARILRAESSWAYAGPLDDLRLRWKIGLGATLLCGLAVGTATGVRRLRSAGRGGRLVLWTLALLGPFTLFAAMLATAVL